MFVLEAVTPCGGWPAARSVALKALRAEVCGGWSPEAEWSPCRAQGEVGVQRQPLDVRSEVEPALPEIEGRITAEDRGLEAEEDSTIRRIYERKG